MVDFSYNKLLYFKRFSIEEFIHITMILMVFPYGKGGDSAGNQSIDCSQFRTCTRCAAKPCDWSMEKQTCANRLENERRTIGLTVRDESHCPRFSSIRKSAFAGETFTKEVNILNDTIGFGSFIRKTRIKCCLVYWNQYGIAAPCHEASIYNNKIICAALHAPSSLFTKKKEALMFDFYITFNNVMLRFDNNGDYYFSVHDHDCGDTIDEDCAVCLWTDNEYMHYLKLCSSRNRCTGLYKFYTKKYVDDYRKRTLTDQAVQVKCPDVIRVQMVEPLYASIMKDTKMKIAVINHRIMNENLAVVVTVAGRNCTDPKTEGNETIICTVRGGPLTHGSQEVVEGPVEVKYGSSPSFIVTSLQTVEFVYPAVTAVHPNYGPLDGGSLLTVSGEFLDDGATALVSIGNISNCMLTEPRSENVIMCTTLPGNVAAAGLINVKFDGRYFSDHRGPGTKTFEYVDGPRLKPGQKFEGIASGGTNITVRGSNFSSTHTTYYVCVYNTGVRVCGPECYVKNEISMVCQLPKLDWMKNLSSLALLKLSTKFSAEQTEFWFRETDMPEIELYSDPVLTDFELKVSNDSSAVLRINGRDLGRGFSVDELDVRFNHNQTTRPCKNMTMTQNDLLCFPSCPTDVLRNLTQLGVIVTVGGSVSYVYEKSTHTTPYNDEHRPTSDYSITHDGEHRPTSNYSITHDDKHRTTSNYSITHDDEHQHNTSHYNDKNSNPETDDHLAKWIFLFIAITLLCTIIIGSTIIVCSLKNKHRPSPPTVTEFPLG